MRYVFVLLACLVLATVSLAAGEDDVKIKHSRVTWEQLAITDGAVLYQELCASCHGADASGDGPAAAALKVPPTDLTRLTGEYDEFPIDELVKTISGEVGVLAHGTSEMPVWGSVLRDVRVDQKPFRREALARLSIHNIAKYIESIQVEGMH